MNLDQALQEFERGANPILPAGWVHNEYGDDRVTYCRTFDSLDQFAKCAYSTPKEKWHEAESNKWAGGTHLQAKRMAMGKGWEESLGMVEAITSHVANLVDAETVSDTFQYRYDVVGGAIDMGKFLTGEPECMIEAHPVPIARRGKVARVVVPITYSAGVPSDLAQRRGAAIVGLIESLARAHYSLEVWAVGVAQSVYGHKRSAYSIKVADAAVHFDPALVAYGVGHTTMFRRLYFNVEMLEGPMFRENWNVPHGMGKPPGDAVLADLPAYAQNGPAVILPELAMSQMYSLWGNDQKIAEWIEKEVARIASGEEYVSDRLN